MEFTLKGILIMFNTYWPLHHGFQCPLTEIFGFKDTLDWKKRKTGGGVGEDVGYCR